MDFVLRFVSTSIPKTFSFAFTEQKLVYRDKEDSEVPSSIVSFYYFSSFFTEAWIDLVANSADVTHNMGICLLWGPLFFNFQQDTTCTADGEEENLSLPSESVSDNQAVRVTDCYNVRGTIQVYGWLDFLQYWLWQSQSLGYLDEGDSELPSWCVSNLLRVDHTEDPSAATSEPVSPSAAIGHQVRLA